MRGETDAGAVFGVVACVATGLKVGFVTPFGDIFGVLVVVNGESFTRGNKLGMIVASENVAEAVSLDVAAAVEVENAGNGIRALSMIAACCTTGGDVFARATLDDDVIAGCDWHAKPENPASAIVSEAAIFWVSA